MTYSWFPVEGLSDPNIANPIFYPNKNTIYKLNVNSPDLGTTMDSILIAINPLTVDCGENKTIICGSKIQLKKPASNYIGSDTLVYSWLPTDGLSSINIAQPIVDVITNTSYSLEIIAPNGCKASDNILINVNPLKAFANDVEINCGDVAQLNATTNYIGLESLIYNWNPANGLNETDIRNPIATVSRNTFYTVEIKTPNGCIASDDLTIHMSIDNVNPKICMVTVDNNSKNVVVINKEQNFSADSILVYCESELLNDQYDLIGTFPYSSTDLFIDNESNANVQSNKYKIAIKDKCGLTSKTSPAHGTCHVTINQGIGNNWNLSWQPYFGIPVPSYNIYRGTSISNMIKIANVPSNISSYTDLTTLDVFYQIEVLLPQVCIGVQPNEFSSIRSNIVSNFDETIGISVNSISFEFLYPNPATDQFSITSEFSKNSMVEIYDIQGKQVFNIKTEEHINISNLSKGVYIVKLIDSGSVLINKLIKE